MMLRLVALSALLSLPAATPALARLDDGPPPADGLFALPPGDPWYEPSPQDRRGPGGRADRLVYKEFLVPHWLDGARFWYRNDGRGGTREFLLVDAGSGSRRPAFDHDRLAAALSAAAGADYRGDRLPFDAIAPDEEGRSVRFRVGDATWKCDLDSYTCKPAGADEALSAEPRAGSAAANTQRPPDRRRDGGDADGPREGLRSPDGKWMAFVRDHNVVVRAEGEAEETRLTDDGKDGLAYGMLSWAPDSQTLAACRIEPGDRHQVHLIRSSPPNGGRAELQSRPYPLPGDKFTAFELRLFRVADRRQIRPEVDRIDFGTPRLRWDDDGRHVTYQQVDRGHQRLRLVEVDAHTGEARNLIDEKTDTFLWTAHAENVDLRPITRLEKTDEIVYASERSGWRHLYLVDAKSGTIKPITSGEYVIRGVDRIDEESRRIWFRASGKNAGQDPYFLHYYRVDFDGTGLVALTEGDGNHTAQFSPDRSYLIDTYSRVDKAPVHELRRTSDGSLVLRLEEADIADLEASGWEAPEVLVAKGRDGQTDIWGVLCRPKGFDPARKYPVIEQIYAGPQGSFVPKSFSPQRRFAALTDLGFVVVQMDGMGTANRSKAFHDVCWHNLKDAGFPDRILWHQAAAAKYPWYDLTRVGITGTSAGGQNATGGVLFHPDFYKAAVSACGCHDNRMDKASWNEQWMGYPVGPWYAESSNIDNAHRLRGKLLLIVGEMDTNVPPESTMRLADALIRAGKDFDLVVVPNAGHGMGGAYGARRMQDFFARHLLGNEPPDRNAAAPPRDAAVTTTALRASAGPDAVAPDSGAVKAADATPFDSGEEDDEPSALRPLIERYAVDRGTLLRSAPPSASPERDERLGRFAQAWLGRLEAVGFTGLDRVGRVDYLLFRNHLKHELRLLETAAKEREAAGPFVPFAGPILDLDRDRRALAPQDWKRVAGTLNDLAKSVAEARRALEAKPRKEVEGSVDRPAAVRAVALADGLRGTLDGWFRFYDGYDPLFSWWNAEPYKAVDEALRGYATTLRDRLGVGSGTGEDDGGGANRRRVGEGGPPANAPGGGPAGRNRAAEAKEDGSDIVGKPIGRAALLDELAFEMVAYTPEELIAIAEAERAWCERELIKAAREMGLGDDWRAAIEKVKSLHVEPGEQPRLIRDLAVEAIEYLDRNDLVTIPQLARDSWRIAMMSPERQLVNPFFTGGETISVSFPTSGMPHEAKLMSLRGNNAHFARATVFHEVIPGHHLQGYMTSRYKDYRGIFSTPFSVEGWALYWELLLWDRGFARSPEDRVGMLFWRMHRCARIIFSLKFHLGEWTPKECIALLVDGVGHERANAVAEVRRSFGGGYGPLYQAAYLLGGLQLRALHRELVESGRMTDRAFHDAVLKQNRIPIDMVRASLADVDLDADHEPTWRFYGPIPGRD